MGKNDRINHDSLRALTLASVKPTRSRQRSACGEGPILESLLLYSTSKRSAVAEQMKIYFDFFTSLFSPSTYGCLIVRHQMSK
jgi:hypothetical protein